MLKPYVFAFAALMATTAVSAQPQEIARRLLDADEKQFAELFPEFEKLGEQGLAILNAEIDRRLPRDFREDGKEKLAKRQANAAAALLRMDQAAKVWPLLKHSPDPRLRSYLIHRFALLGVDPEVILNRLTKEPDITIRRALILSLGEYKEEAFSVAAGRTCVALLPRLQEFYRNDTDPGLHAAIEWLLRQWEQEPWVENVNQDLANDKSLNVRRLQEIQQTLAKNNLLASPEWYVNRQGQTMVVIPGPVEFQMGSPWTESGRHREERQHRVRIDRNFVIGAKEVTVEQFLRFRKDHPYENGLAHEMDCPVDRVSWWSAAEYCNWLSRQEDIPQDEWCYLPNKDGKYANGMTIAPNHLQRSGYRLPTEAEWEYACRAGATTAFCFGESPELAHKYAWHGNQLDRQLHPAKFVKPIGRRMNGNWIEPVPESELVGLTKPNDLGLWNMHGNVREWTQDAYQSYPIGEAVTDDGQNAVSEDQTPALRGGTLHWPAADVRSAARSRGDQIGISGTSGLRLARTLPRVLLNPPGSSVEESEIVDDSEAIKEIESVGGTIERSDTLAGHPVIGVSFAETPRLQRLSISFHPNDRYLRLLQSFKNLTKLSFSGSPIKDDFLDGLGLLKNLTELELSQSDITDADLQGLGELPNLKILNIYSNGITDAGLKEISELKSLTWLRVHHTQITDAGLKELQGLKNLTSLSLCENKITGVGMEGLNGLTNLTSLEMNTTMLNDEGLKEVCKLRTLESLQLSKTYITDEGLKELRQLNHLTSLGLYGTRITDAGVKDLCELKHLHWLYLNFTLITDTGLKDLMKALPNAQIISR